MGETPTYQGVHVDHPTIVDAIKNLVKQGRRREDIVRIVGMPHEVVQSVEQRMSRRDRGK